MFDLAFTDTLAPALPSLYAPDVEARRRTVEFFTAHIRNPNTRKAYAQAGADFSRWCGRNGILDVLFRPSQSRAFAVPATHAL